MNADFICKRGGRDGGDHGSGKQVFPHFVLLDCVQEECGNATLCSGKCRGQ
jgi:hypothetical protein